MTRGQLLELIWTRDLALFTLDLWWQRMIDGEIRRVWGVAPAHQINHFNGKAVELYRIHQEQEAFLEAMANVPLTHRVFQPDVWETAERSASALRGLVATQPAAIPTGRREQLEECFRAWVAMYPGFSWASHFPGIFLRERFLKRHGGRIQPLLDQWYQRRAQVEGLFEQADEFARLIVAVTLVDAGADAADVHLLRLSEVEALVKHEEVPAQAGLDDRRAGYWLVNEQLSTGVNTDSFLREHDWALPRVEGDVQAGLKGTVAMSAPRPITGPAFLVLSKADIGKFPRGSVLVAPMTWPDVIPAMKQAAAIVTDEGGLACHAAIVSRELGIPCVVGTKHATRLLQDGDTVEVDATNGTVRRIDA